MQKLGQSTWYILNQAAGSHWKAFLCFAAGHLRCSDQSLLFHSCDHSLLFKLMKSASTPQRDCAHLTFLLLDRDLFASRRIWFCFVSASVSDGYTVLLLIRTRSSARLAHAIPYASACVKRNLYNAIKRLMFWPFRNVLPHFHRCRVWRRSISVETCPLLLRCQLRVRIWLQMLKPVFCAFSSSTLLRAYQYSRGRILHRSSCDFEVFKGPFGLYLFCLPSRSKSHLFQSYNTIYMTLSFPFLFLCSGF